MLDAIVLQVYEVRFRPEAKREALWVERQVGKMERRSTPSNGAHRQGRAASPTSPLPARSAFSTCAWRAVGATATPSLSHGSMRFAAEVPSFETTRFKG